ncbi:MAG: hypothetical protein EOO41_03550, partial [Methanobacteriota archaeon]
MDDAVALQLKLDWCTRLVEEKSSLVDCLRADVNALLAANDALTANVATLKSVQDVLVAEKARAEAEVEEVRREKAELASENARLHVYAKDAAGRAERALATAAELKRIADARAAAEELVLTSGDGAGDTAALAPPTARGATACSASELQAARILISRLLLMLGAAGVDLVPLRRQLLQPIAAESGLRGSERSSATSLTSDAPQALHMTLLRAIASQLGEPFEVFTAASTQARSTSVATPAPTPSVRDAGGAAAIEGATTASTPLAPTDAAAVHAGGTLFDAASSLPDDMPTRPPSSAVIGVNNASVPQAALDSSSATVPAFEHTPSTTA